MYKDQDTRRLERAAREVFDCEPDEIRCEGCRGPLDQRWSPDCHIRACADGHGVTFCYECADFPCEELASFSADRYEIPISNLSFLADAGLAAWLAEQEDRWRCPACRKPVDIYAEKCSACGAQISP
jgi:hypothetical protein